MRKTWFSYLEWMSFVIITAAFAAAYLPAASAALLRGNQYTAVSLVFLAAVLAVVCWFAGQKTAGIFAGMVSEGKVWKSARFRQALEIFSVVCLLAASVAYRMQLLKNTGVPKDSIYYDMAFINNAGGVPSLAHGASYCYAAVLSTLFSFSGNKAAAGLVLQAALQALSLLLLYLGIRRMAGKTEAFWSVAILAFLPSYTGKIYELEPETFYFFLWVLGVFLIGQCGMAKGRTGSRIAFLLAGIYIGAMGFLDISGWLLSLFAGWLCIKKVKKEDGEEEARKEKRRDSGKELLFCLLGAAGGMVFCLALDAALSGLSLESIWNTWLGLYSWRGSAWILSGPESDPFIGSALCFGNMLMAAGFWFRKERRQEPEVWTLLLLAAAAFHIGLSGPFGYHVLFAFAWAVPAGLGIASMGVCREPGQPVKAKVPDLVLEDMDQADEEEEEKTTGVKLIENPLPLPKKHVRREMDFDRLVECDKMKFDVPVDESDDFDI